jgi:hypothetical protein
MADFLPQDTTFQALQDRIPFGRFRDIYVFFLGGTPWNRPTEITTFFAYNSGRCGPILLIFELDRDINKTVLCTKFHHNRINL